MFYLYLMTEMNKENVENKLPPYTLKRQPNKRNKKCYVCLNLFISIQWNDTCQLLWAWAWRPGKSPPPEIKV